MQARRGCHVRLVVLVVRIHPRCKSGDGTAVALVQDVKPEAKLERVANVVKPQPLFHAGSLRFSWCR